jgi:glycine/D-amino acid oxidase-like deaminating enzyme
MKVGIVGAGKVGSACALALAVRGCARHSGGIPRGAGPMASENPYDPTRRASGGAPDSG